MRAVLASIFLSIFMALSLTPAQAQSAAYTTQKPDIAALETMGHGCPAAGSVYVQGIGLYKWNGASTATASSPWTIQCTGVTTGRMELDPSTVQLNSFDTVAAAQTAFANSPDLLLAKIMGAQGAGMQFERVSCGGTGQPSCTADDVVTFSISGDATHVLQRQVPGNFSSIAAVWGGAIGNNNPVGTAGTDDCVALQRDLDAGKIYQLPVNLGGLGYLVNYTAGTCPGLTYDPVYTSIIGPGSLDFRNWTVAQTGLPAITLQTTTSLTAQSSSLFSITRPLSNLSLFGPDQSTGVYGVKFADYSPATPAKVAGINIENVSADGFAANYVIGSGNWGITWNSPIYWGVGGRVTGTFLKLAETTGIERLVINNPIVAGNDQIQQAFLVDAGRAGTSDVYLHGGSLDALTYISTGQTTTVGDTDPVVCLHVSQTHIENMSGLDYPVRLGNGGCAVFRDLGAFSFVSSSPHTTPVVLNNASTGDIGFVLDNVLTNVNNSNNDGFELAVDGSGPVSVSHVHGGNGAATMMVAGAANNLIPNWLFPTTPLGGTSPFTTSGAGSVTYDTTTIPGANGAVPAPTGSLKLDATAGSVFLKYPFACQPGQLPMFSFDVLTSGVTAGGVAANFTMWFADSAGNVIGGTHIIWSTTTDIASWTLKKALTYVAASSAVAAPPGTAQCVVQWSFGSTAAEQMWIARPQIILQ